MKRIGALLLSFSLLTLSACATRFVTPPAQNPPPQRTIASFKKIELRPLAVAPDVKGKEPKVEEWVQEKLDARIKPLVASWSGSGKGKGTLVLEPRIEKLKFISTGERILGGALSGGSAIIMSLDMTEADSGKKIGSPSFYQHANAMGSAYSFGSTDREMLNRVVRLMEDYLKANAKEAVGGPSGADK